MVAIQVLASGKSDVGRVRSNNEDNFLISNLNTGEIGDILVSISPGKGIYMIVADGMGGAAAGEVASMTAVNSSIEFLKNNLNNDNADSIVVESLNVANRSVRLIQEKNPETKGMGAVATALLLVNSTAHIAQVGDSRLYLLRNNQLLQKTEDQSLVAEMVKRGTLTAQEAINHPQRGAVTQAIGAVEVLKPVSVTLILEKGDRLLLCSDGLYDMVPNEEIARRLADNNEIGKICVELIQTANENGGKDNITVIIVDIQ